MMPDTHRAALLTLTASGSGPPAFESSPKPSDIDRSVQLPTKMPPTWVDDHAAGSPVTPTTSCASLSRSDMVQEAPTVAASRWRGRRDWHAAALTRQAVGGVAGWLRSCQLRNTKSDTAANTRIIKIATAVPTLTSGRAWPGSAGVAASRARPGAR